ncbi:MBL fold metallo-hydrolase [Patulibacter defluvii]|uniref:MBL fold metallo-hydrolase n=1 Tax=Patulibacter defluvii TaxID=3095358 RepID=UPI002A74CE8D|nr:MBL fold metallo-hydrolase [Patulibacter sp. DM4]
MSSHQPSATPAGIVRLNRLHLVNAYLVPEEDGLTLVDTMLGGSAKAILAAAAELGQPIARIVLTHAHDDHVASLDALAAALPDAEVLISARDARLLAGDRSLDPDEPAAKLRGAIKGQRTAPTRLLADGDRVGSLRVIAAPGHTPGHVALLDERDETLLCGDAFTTVGGVATTATIPWRFPLAGVATWHRPTALSSCRTLQALEPARLAPGHGAIVEGPGPAIARAIERAAR